MSPISPSALPVLVARGFRCAVRAWKVLLVLLAVNALLALALAFPIASALHETLDPLPVADAVVKGGETTFWDHFTRNRPDVLGNLGSFGSLFGAEPEAGGLLHLQGAAGSLLALGLLNAVIASIFAGGLAVRFADGSEKDSRSFAADAARLALPSLALSVAAAAGIGGAWFVLFAAPSRLYDPGLLTFEWEAIVLALLRLSAFLVAAGLVRMAVLAARATMGRSGKWNPFLALATGTGRVAGSPLRALSLEVTFGLLGLGPLVVWALAVPVWDGKDLAKLALFVLAETLMVLWRILVRVAQLGAVSAWCGLGSSPPSAV